MSVPSKLGQHAAVMDGLVQQSHRERFLCLGMLEMCKSLYTYSMCKFPFWSLLPMVPREPSTHFVPFLTVLWRFPDCN